MPIGYAIYLINNNTIIGEMDVFESGELSSVFSLMDAMSLTKNDIEHGNVYIYVDNEGKWLFSNTGSVISLLEPTIKKSIGK